MSACLHALAAAHARNPIDVVIIDDGSDEGVSRYLDLCSGVRIARAQPEAAVDCINDVLNKAPSELGGVLTGDTIVTECWLPELFATMDADANIAAAGSRLLRPDETLLEAGSILWSDGQATNYAPDGDAVEGALFMRDVDYCSSASLLMRLEAFRHVGGFDRAFTPTVYGDADLCLRLSKAGFRVVYQPSSMAAHLERLPPRRGVTPQQRTASKTFHTRWSASLEKHCAPDPQHIDVAARRVDGNRTMLVMDSLVPDAQRDAGSRRLVMVMRLLKDLGWRVIFVPHLANHRQEAAAELRRFGVEVRLHRGDAFSALLRLPLRIDFAWLSRPDVCQRYMPFVRTRLGATVMYDTVDLHHVRLRRQEEVTEKATLWHVVRELEFTLMRQADATIVTSSVEQELLSRCGVDAHIVPVMESVGQPAVLAGRCGVLFFGNFTHAPNVDAARYLCEVIMPIVWRRVPEARVTIAGFDSVPVLSRLASDRVRIAGYVTDVEAMHGASRVFVAPLRYGAGMKGKIVASLAFGLPVVTSPIGAEGIPFENGLDACVADNAEAMADATVALLHDDDLWQRFSERARDLALRYDPHVVRAELSHILAQVTAEAS